MISEIPEALKPACRPSDGRRVTVDALELCLDRLRETADCLEASARRIDRAVPRSATTAAAPPARRGSRSLRAIVRFTVVHTALTVAVLTGTTAVVDPLLPHPERPHLSESVTTPADTSAGAPSIPQQTAHQP